MNKAQLIDAIAEGADLPKAVATKALDAVLSGITRALVDKDVVSLVDFGKFEVKHRKARVGRNPKTGEEIQISESYVPSFKAGKSLKDAVNDK